MQLELRVHVSMPGRPDIMLLSHDWSRSALFLRDRAPLPVGTIVQLAVVVPGERRPVTFSGKVTRVVPEFLAGGARPPGMAVAFGRLPSPLSVHLSKLAAKQKLLRPPEQLASRSEQPVLLLFGGAGLDRIKYSLLLETNGFDVTSVDTVDLAALAIAKGLRPRITVVVGDPAEAMEFDRRTRMVGVRGPQLMVILGSLPGFTGGSQRTVLSLPHTTGPDLLLAHLKGELAATSEEEVPQPPRE